MFNKSHLSSRDEQYDEQLGLANRASLCSVPEALKREQGGFFPMNWSQVPALKVKGRGAGEVI
ncbi:hypothetical protein EYF80_024558 [Liparis tanakae]|uniref:Uncharacterized protein n=1 Tax=Liparis tanakae TaxID=230148 RepID=A0A4Z2HH98_9TELE|nr:hypothetical protein EYF80_024558 [Liparis tanakae]